MPYADMYIEYLKAEGYRPAVSDNPMIAPRETVIEFKMEGGEFFIVADEDDPGYFVLVFPNFWQLDTEEARQAALRCADQVNKGNRGARVYLSGDCSSVFAATDTFLPRPEDFQVIFPRSCAALIHAVKTFYDLIEPA